MFLNYRLRINFNTLWHQNRIMHLVKLGCSLKLVECVWQLLLLKKEFDFWNSRWVKKKSYIEPYWSQTGFLFHFCVYFHRYYVNNVFSMNSSIFVNFKEHIMSTTTRENKQDYIRKSAYSNLNMDKNSYQGIIYNQEEKNATYTNSISLIPRFSST